VVRREVKPTGWEGRFKRVYLPKWMWFAGLLASYIAPPFAIVYVNLFAVEGYAV